MEKIQPIIQSLLDQLQLNHQSLGVQILFGVSLVFLMFIILLLISKRKNSKLLKEYAANLTIAADEKVFILKDKNELSLQLQEKDDEITQMTKALEKDQQDLSSLEEKLKETTNSFLHLSKEKEDALQNLEQERLKFEADSNTFKTIIQSKDAEVLKTNKIIETIKEQLKRESSENQSLNNLKNEFQKKIVDLEAENAKTKDLMHSQENQLSVLNQEQSQKKKRLEEESRVKEYKNKINNLKNKVFQCFLSIDHPIFKCYQSDETKGTYLHVNQVSNLSQIAAEAIGGNPLYAKASALFHDLGKTAIFKYFKENWPHNKTLKLENENFSYSYTHRGYMICSHVERGVQIFNQLMKTIPPDVEKVLDQLNLSIEEKRFVFEEAKESLQKSILEHQARAHVRMLYNEAIKNGEICKPEDFEYMIGQVPSDKEQGIICLADSCEAAFSSNIYESEEAVSNLINNVVTGRVNSGHMDESGLTTKDIQKIKKAFTDYLLVVWKSKRPDRMEEKVDLNKDDYSLHESENEIVKKMVQRFKQGDENQKRQVLRNFIALKHKTLMAVNNEELIAELEVFLNTESNDNILLTNSIVVLCELYKHLAQHVIEGINKQHPIDFNLTEETVDLELMQNSDISAFIEAKPDLKNHFAKMQRLRELISISIRKHRLYESPDVYITNWSSQIDNYLSNQSNISEAMIKTDMQENKLENVVTLSEGTTTFVTTKQGKLYISVNLDIFRSDCKFILFVVYFSDSKKSPLRDQGGLFCTKDTKQVAISQSFIIKNSKYFTIKEPPIVMSQNELHLPANYTETIFARIQVHGIKADDKPILMFDHFEEVELQHSEVI